MKKKTFRSAFRGFNRQDVVQYIEMLNQQHATQINQLNSQLQAAKENAGNQDLLRQLEEINARCAELEAALSKGNQSADMAAEELEAYRRAERAERVAQEKADQIYAKATAVLADATVKAESASTGLAESAQQITQQISAYQESIQAAKSALEEAVTALYAIRPEE